MVKAVEIGVIDLFCRRVLASSTESDYKVHASRMLILILFIDLLHALLLHVHEFILSYFDSTVLHFDEELLD